ncbi:MULTISPECIES: CIS tube protein [Chryseobacterium]|uniref:LysM peptidoglycan-binding domain-containing protein n=2 Tax=Chryseobacterium TaxID=59732 RepID=A0A3D9AIS9_9FLAO|nr:MULTISPECIES: LysM peptidoglycan-binding domain-containing protein [Chryseobacterium]MDO3423370.1 LysM peptidoglycan-binding domain-containing protein [Chryseobacterium sp. APV1]REC41240.1 LysM peptidoglycan-binding domain-containing protein [Candidatus Chryseobacterium massiliae]WBV53847.1 LysM peptidoglycan-binding domain-containing protein [Chryseobacterium gambrini]
MIGEIKKTGGEVLKVKIGTYKDINFKSVIDSDAFEAFINPTGFSFTSKIEYNTAQEQGAAGSSPKFVKVAPQALQMEFLFDGTGVTETYSGNKLVNVIKKNKFKHDTVNLQLERFYKATGEFKGSFHKPYSVIVIWGEFEFKGALTEFTVDYKMFNKDGTPLRAIGKATFVEGISQELIAEKAKKSSPDLTHKRTVQAGDTLPLMTERIYGDSKYYLEVAKVNNLINFRQLKPGTELYFPPIEKIA